MTTEIFTYEEMKVFTAQYCVGSSGQIRDIIFELFYSANEWHVKNPEEAIEPDREHFLACIRSIVNELKLAHTYTGDKETDYLFGLPLEEYKAKLTNLTETEKSKLNYRYDTFWQSKSIASLINTGNLFDDKECGLLEIDELETIADSYINSFWMKSKTLEWALINSMVYLETVNFARVVNDFPTMKFFNAIRYSLWQTTKLAFKEIIALIITAIVANAIDSSQGTTYWIVFATITIIRWLNPTKSIQLNLKLKLKLLLGEMIGVSDSKIKHPNFNPKLIRELLYDLERKGASYSHWIYHILDRRLKT